jgi:predicted house-cleaning NTP pyrophosphatase (Maf/HAM1 superfamily)
MDSNMINLDDIYQIVWASNSKRREELLEFISDLIDIESDVMYEG